MDNKTKETILSRIYDSKSSVCSFCLESCCAHGGNRKLPETLNTIDVLKAINIDEYFFKED